MIVVGDIVTYSKGEKGFRNLGVKIMAILIDDLPIKEEKTQV
jgi:hypothetical protein